MLVVGDTVGVVLTLGSEGEFWRVVTLRCELVMGGEWFLVGNGEEI